MSPRTVGRMLVAPAGVAIAVAVMLQSLGAAAFLLACAAFVGMQLIVVAQSELRLAAAKRRLRELRSQRRLRSRG